VVHEADAHRADQYSSHPENPYCADDLERQCGDGRIQCDDVERQPFIHELNGEDVVVEDHTDLILDHEDVREVQRDLGDEQIDDGREPQHQVGRIAVATQPPYRPPKGEHRTADHQQFQHRQGPVGQHQRVTDVHEPGSIHAREIA